LLGDFNQNCIAGEECRYQRAHKVMKL
jgi:hypothetical protein